MVNQAQSARRCKIHPVGRFGWWALALVVILLGAVVRAVSLDKGSLWGDEGFTVVPSGYGGWDIPSAMPIGTFSLYYVAVHLWMNGAGGSELALRYPSLWTGVALLAVAFALARRLAGPRVGMAAALLCAVSPPLVDYADTARPYALVVLLLALNCYALLRIASAPSPVRWWLVALGSVIAAAYSHLFALTVVPFDVLLFAWVAMEDRRWRWRFALGCVILGIAFAPWLAFSARATLAHVAARAASEPLSIASYLDHVRNGLLVADVFPGVVAHRDLLEAIAGLGLLLGIVTLSRRSAGRATIVSLWILFPIAAGYAIVHFVPYFDGRYLLFLSVPFTAVASAGLAAERRALAVVSAVALLAMVGVWAPQTYQQVILAPREDLGPLALDLRTRARSGDVIITNSQWREMNLDYYIRELHVPVDVFPDGPPASPSVVQAQIDAATQNQRRVWVVLYGAPEGTATGYIGATLSQRFAQVYGHWYGTTQLALFQAPSRSAQMRPVDTRFGSALELVDLSPPAPRRVQPGAGVVIPLRWRVDDPGDYALSLRLVDEQGRVWAQADSPATPNPASPPKSAPKDVTINRGLVIPWGTPPGEYHLAVTAYDAKSGKPLLAKRPNGTTVGPVVQLAPVKVRQSASAPPASLLPIERRRDDDFGALRFLGGTWTQRSRPASRLI